MKVPQWWIEGIDMCRDTCEQLPVTEDKYVEGIMMVER